MTWYYGNASWYDLCLHGAHQSSTPGGACGDCDDWESHIAWPTLGEGCRRACGGNERLECNAEVYIVDHCRGQGLWGMVKDCCTCDEAGCELVPRCDGSLYESQYYLSPLVDLTTAFFIYLHGSLDDGRIPVQVYH